MAQFLELALATAQLPAGRTALEQQLRTSPYWPLRQLVCELDDDQHLIVRGTVPSYYLKQVAQSLVAKTVGSEYVRSNIDVQSKWYGDAAVASPKNGIAVAVEF
jgi:hypothetical protein